LIRRCWLPCALALALTPAGRQPAADAMQQAIMDVVVNGQNLGQQFLAFNGKNEVVVDKKLLYSFHIKKDKLDGSAGEQVDLRSLPELKFELGDALDELRLTIPPDWFEDTVIQKDKAASAYAPDREPIRQAAFSGFLNYQLQGHFSDTQGIEGFNLPLDAGINHGQWFAFNSLTAGYAGGNHGAINIHRQLTNLIWDDAPNFRSLTLGDFTPPAQPLLASRNLGGISWGTKFYVDRNFRAYPDLDLETMIESATHAELISNGQKIKEWDLSPGRVLFSDIGQYAGYNSTLLLTDAYGKQRTLSVPAFTSNQLLKAGLHEYNYSVGMQRNLEQNNWGYGHPLVSGFHRYGFDNQLTAGIAFASDGRKMLLSPSINIAAFANHKFNLAVAGETGEHGTHYAGLAGYLFRLQRFYGSSTFNYLSRDYDGGFGANGARPQKYQWNASIGYSHAALGNISVDYAHTVEEQRPAQHYLALMYQKQIGSAINIAFAAKAGLDAATDNSISLTLRYYPGEGQRKYFDMASYQIGQEGDAALAQELAIQKFNTRGLGLGYNLALNSEGGNVYGSLRSQYNDERGIATGNYNVSKTGQSNLGFSWAGGVAFLDDGIYNGRPVNDSFAVVKVSGKSNVPVKLYDSIAGYTNDEGELLVPELTSYMINRLTIQDDILTINEKIDTTEQRVAFKQRGGSKVEFEISKFTAIEGNITRIDPNGKPVTLASVPIEIAVNAQRYQSFIGRNGYFYLENIPVGELVLSVQLYQGNCTTIVKVPAADAIVQNLGQLTCRIPGPSGTQKRRGRQGE